MGNAGHENDLGEQQLEPQVWALTAEVKMHESFKISESSLQHYLEAINDSLFLYISRLV